MSFFKQFSRPRDSQAPLPSSLSSLYTKARRLSSHSSSGSGGSSRYSGSSGNGGYSGTGGYTGYAGSGSGSSYGGSSYGSGGGSNYTSTSTYTPTASRSSYGSSSNQGYSSGGYSSSSYVPSSSSAPYTSRRNTSDYSSSNYGNNDSSQNSTYNTSSNRRSMRDRSTDRAVSTPHNTRRSIDLGDVTQTTYEPYTPGSRRREINLSEVTYTPKSTRRQSDPELQSGASRTSRTPANPSLRESSSERLYETPSSRTHTRNDSSSSVTSYDAVFDESKNRRTHKRNASTDSWDSILEEPFEIGKSLPVAAGVKSRTPLDSVFSEPGDQNPPSPVLELDIPTSSVEDVLTGSPGMGSRKESTSGTRKRSVKRDLEQILGHDDHQLVQRIISENKDMFKETELELSPEEKVLVQKISDACRTGIEINCSEILKIVSHQTAAVM